MAALWLSWIKMFAMTLLLLHLCRGRTSCVMWSSIGNVVQLGSSFDMYCTFTCECDHSMSSGHPPAPQTLVVVNASTSRFHVANITEDTTYSCQCGCPTPLEPCGLDIRAEDPPEPPTSISCEYEVLSTEEGVLYCWWDKVRISHPPSSTELWLTSVSEYEESRKVFSLAPTANEFTFNVSNKVHEVLLWVHTHYTLGSSLSQRNYTLADIARPCAPEVGGAECWSRGCTIRVCECVRSSQVEVEVQVQHAMDGQHSWSSCQLAEGQLGLDQIWSTSSLDPGRLYRFRSRAKFSTGLWSKWSTVRTAWTQEEVPDKVLDVWYIQPSSTLTFITVFWKAMSVSEARGKILEYRVSVYGAESEVMWTSSLGANVTKTSVPFCARCQVALWAINSKGSSPPANITAHHAKAAGHFQVRTQADQHGVALWWSAAAPAARHVVLEWHLEGLMTQHLHWLRLPGTQRHAHITGLKSSECYQANIYFFYDESTSTTSNFQLSINQTVQQEVEGKSLKVKWAELPRTERGGCVVNYTVYLQYLDGHVLSYLLPASHRKLLLSDLHAGNYYLWMTASTSEGQSPAGPKVRFSIQSAKQDVPLFLFVGGIILLVMSLLMCCHISPRKKRCVGPLCFLSKVPDPANSKWAKECSQKMFEDEEKFQLSESSMKGGGGGGEEEEELIIEVEELSNVKMDASSPSIISTYIKTYCQPSLSHTSFCSHLTHLQDHHLHHLQDHHLHHLGLKDHNLHHLQDHDLHHLGLKDHRLTHLGLKDHDLHHLQDHGLHLQDHDLHHLQDHGLHHLQDHGLHHLQDHGLHHLQDHDLHHLGLKDHRLNHLGLKDHDLHHLGLKDHDLHHLQDHDLHHLQDHELHHLQDHGLHHIHHLQDHGLHHVHHLQDNGLHLHDHDLHHLQDHELHHLQDHGLHHVHHLQDHGLHLHDHDLHHLQDHELHHLQDHGLHHVHHLQDHGLHLHDHDLHHLQDHGLHHLQDHGLHHLQDHGLHHVHHLQDHGLHHLHDHDLHHLQDHGLHHLQDHDLHHLQDHGLHHLQDHGLHLQDHDLHHLQDRDLHHLQDHHLHDHDLHHLQDHDLHDHEDEEECSRMMTFIPASHSFTHTLDLTLTLDTVHIDCGIIFDNLH
ncbi:interleukin-12 receptor subunit beta-2 isoform X2 [Entelurus aequoreus]|uniref:interleukin-12 receptor subunit beta-2 isoform X2 n=1 Tax=Entelurus aequoreus TaxID=161455 RepID=UPI002B1E34D3|nr:interleukin-12 receptor subunit beta-2 isoform X2 [Entelurus aequoreus]